MKYRLTILTLFLCLVNLSMAQNITTMGTDFWFSYMKGRIEASMSVTITGLRACSGTISNPNTGWSTNFQVPANGSVSITIDTATCYNTVSNVIANKGIHITTTDTVSVYACNYLSTSFDVTYVLPTDVLQDEYVVQTYETSRSVTPCEVMVVALKDSTIVDITPTCGIVNYNSSASTMTVILNEGQCYFMQCDNIDDFSGTRIKARNCDKIAVFNGHECANVPASTGTYCDHLFEQAIPISFWGKKYVVTSSANHNGDVVKITSLQDGCTVWHNNVPISVINAGQSIEVFLTGNPVANVIQTSKPSTVYIYLESKNVAGPDGDPAMILIPPLEQEINDVVFVSYQTPLVSTHRLNIVTKTSNTQNIFLDGVSLMSSFTIVPSDAQYSYARVILSGGSHHIVSNGGSGFVAHAYGVGSNESYGYAIGFSTRRLNSSLNIGSHMSVSDRDTIEVCQGHELNMNVETMYDYDSIVWSLGDETSATGSSVNHTYLAPGYYYVRTIVSRESECFSGSDTLSTVLYIKSIDSTVVDTSVCEAVFEWNGLTYNSSGVYYDTMTSYQQCDSLVILHLSVNDTSSSQYTIEGCDSVLFHGIPFYSSDVLIDETLVNSNGCDSLRFANINIYHSVSNTLDITLKEGDSSFWYNGSYLNVDTNRMTFYYHTIHGCDSLVTIYFHYIAAPQPPPIDSSELWVPNAFTPDLSTNREFRVFSNDIIHMTVYIFNRWGEYVTEFDGLINSWNGTCDGVPCKQETYVYLIEYTTKTKPHYIQRKIGTVTLLR